MSKRGSHTLEQVVKCCNCMSAPPIGCCSENNEYLFKEGNGKQIGIAKEDSNCFCRTCCTPSMRTSEGYIEVDDKRYGANKGCRLGYYFQWCCCERPDVILTKDGQVIGSVELPCYPANMCKIEVVCYKGDQRNEESRLWTLTKCYCNCHTLYGKTYGCCCDSCKYMDFEVKPGPKCKGKTPSVQKEHFGSTNECYTMADKYNFDLPGKDKGKKTAILLAAIQFIDMLYFENNYWGGGGV